jgi:hypothetical protein
MKFLQFAWILLLGSQFAFAESDSDFLKTAPKSDLFPSLTSSVGGAPLAGLLTLKAAEIDLSRIVDDNVPYCESLAEDVE